jgi:hypothetical protein
MKYLFLLIFLFQTEIAAAQSSCSSDKAAPVHSITERFTNADCAACWAKPFSTGKPGGTRTTQTLDWIAPSPAGDDAPLSAAANRDALLRLENLKIKLPKEQQIVQTGVIKSAYKIRVAHGLAVGGYIGASIELTQFPPHPPINKSLTAVLLLTETIPKGTADTPIERTLVRNMLVEPWLVATSAPQQTGKQVILTRRPLSIPQGTNPDNLHVFGWVQDDQGRVLAAAKSTCTETE